MSIKPPRYERRGERELRQELIDRARAWIPGWEPGEDNDDEFAKAMFAIAARLAAEATQRLDRVGEKNFRGLLQWLGVKGRPARAARMPVVFSMTPKSPSALARKPIRLQAKAVDPPVVFETQQDVQVVAASPIALVGVRDDAFYTSPVAIYRPQPPQPVPSRWRITSDAEQGAQQLQLNPSEGLQPGDAVRIEHLKSDDAASETIKEYRIVAARAGIVSIQPPLFARLAAQTVVTRAASFDPFGISNDEQLHELYIGDGDVLNIEGEALIRIANLGPQFEAMTWEYSAKDGWSKLAPTFADGDLLLKKAQGSGAIEKTKVGGVESRWLRASASKPARNLSVARLQLRINCENKPDPKTTGKADQSPPALAMAAFANTAPLVLDQNFYPLGIEPRVFDAFYLSCPEAFSKPHAKVDITINFAAPTMTALAATRMPGSNNALIFGVGHDGQLHRLQHDVRLNRISYLAPIQVRVERDGKVVRPVKFAKARVERGSAATVGSDAVVAIAAEDGVWLWTESAQAGASQWMFLGKPAVEAEVDQALVLANGNRWRVYALSGRKLWCTEQTDDDETPQWGKVSEMAIERIAPVLGGEMPLAGGKVGYGLVLIDHEGKLFSDMGGDLAPASVALGTNKELDRAVAPLAVLAGNELCIVAKLAGENTLLAKRAGAAEPAIAEDVQLAADSTTVFDFQRAANGELTVFFITQTTPGADETRRASWWWPFDAERKAIVFSGPDPGGFATVNGAPVMLMADNGTVSVLAPGNKSDVLSMPFAAGRVATVPVSLQDVLAVSFNGNVADDDLVLLEAGGERLEPIARAVRLSGNNWLLRLKDPLLHPLDEAEIKLFHPVATHTVERASDKRIRFATAGDVPVLDTIAVATAQGKRLFKITNRKDEVATLNRPLPNDATFQIQVLEELGTTNATLKTAVGTAGMNAAALQQLRSSDLYFIGAQPQLQHIASSLPLPAAADFLLLESSWTKVPATANVDVLTATAQAGWSIHRPQVQANPKLSYEYWDGKGWWKIEGLSDGTEDFLHNGTLSFCLPADFAETEVAGRKARWIRARLVGGDYGAPEVTVTMIEGQDLAKNKQVTQIMDRNIDAVRAPLAISIEASYQVCCSVTPANVLTHDNGAFVDQSEANRSDAARVTVFPALETALGGDSTRALYLGFDAPLSGAPVNLLFVLQQADHHDAFPLTVEALNVAGFEPVLVKDGTRGLSETGIVSLVLPTPPVRAALFGKEGYWLRIKPNARAAIDQWNPRVTAVFLNAAMAIASETQELELLGSSDGSPNLKASLARAPVVAGSLELRVREPLTDEQATALLDKDADAVKENLRNLGGRWVLWHEVADPHDHERDARVYSLDADTGVVQFGDGRNGAVPPIGRDAILAVRYQRSGDARANEIDAWSSIALVTSIAGVQSVVIPEPAAGGTNAQTPAEVLRTAPARLQHRDRALSLRDMESVAQGSSSDVVQAVAKRGAAGSIRVTIVGRAPDEVPTPATLRHVRAALLAAAPPDLACSGRLLVVAPELLRTRVELQLLIADIEEAGEVASEATVRIARLLDTVVGGLDGAGWPVGARPEDADFAAALTDLPGLEGILESRCWLLREGGESVPLPARIRPDQLVVVDEGDIEIEFKPVADEVSI